MTDSAAVKTNCFFSVFAKRFSASLFYWILGFSFCYPIHFSHSPSFTTGAIRLANNGFHVVRRFDTFHKWAREREKKPEAKRVKCWNHTRVNPIQKQQSSTPKAYPMHKKSPSVGSVLIKPWFLCSSMYNHGHHTKAIANAQTAAHSNAWQSLPLRNVVSER